MKKILYVRKHNDVFLRNFINSLDLNYYNLLVLDLENGKFIDINNNITLKLGFTSKNRIINYILRFINATKFIFQLKKQNIDIVHILNIKFENFWLIPIFKKRGVKVILTIYGRSTYTYKLKRLFFSMVYKYVDIITFSNQSLIDEFIGVYGDKYSNKTVRIIPPIVTIDDRRKEDVSSILNDFFRNRGIKNELIKISCSSTIASYDQHDKVIDSLRRINCSEKVQLLFLLTYGGSNAEKTRIISKIRNELNAFDVVVFDSFLTEEELLAYRMSTDIYVNMRTSDQLAGAVIESLYSGALLISGKWLNYGTFDDIGIYYKKVNDFKDLTSYIEESVKNFDFFKSNYRNNNINKISQEFSMEPVMKKWNRIYQM